MQVGKIKGTAHVGGRNFHLDPKLLTVEDLDMGRKDAEAFLGDEGARVSVSLDMSDKNYGTGIGAMITVQLTCNQDNETIKKAHSLASSLAVEYLEVTFAMAQDLGEDHGLLKEQ